MSTLIARHPLADVLTMTVGEFFTQERLVRAGAAPGIARHVSKTLSEGRDACLTLSEFRDLYPSQESLLIFVRVNGFGDKILDAFVRAMVLVGLDLARSDAEVTRWIFVDTSKHNNIHDVADHMMRLVRSSPETCPYAVFRGVELTCGGGDTHEDIVKKYHKRALAA